MLGHEAQSEGIVTGWSVDSRTVEPGDLFFALRGPNHDGTAYVEEVLAKGAAGAVADQPVGDARCLVVPDTQAALEHVGAWARQEWNGDVVGVTGSAGKTSTKDVIAELLNGAQATPPNATDFSQGRTEDGRRNPCSAAGPLAGLFGRSTTSEGADEGVGLRAVGPPSKNSITGVLDRVLRPCIRAIHQP